MVPSLLTGFAMAVTEFEIGEGILAERGTEITLYINSESEEF